MSLSMYAITTPVFTRMLANLADILQKGETFAEHKKIDPSVLLNMRLAPDMFPLTRQVQIATDGVKGCIARLAGMDVPVYEDTEQTFADLLARIRRTIDFIESIPAERIEGTEDKEVLLKLRTEEVRFQGQAYVLNFVQPNLYFHVTTTYAILRHAGVEIGKRDFLGPR
ncbi:DUF1993 domain-containing protein [Burkholderiaceae bacterium DAT-1]|nr:DUF1993 domain-containing protein [Burkholderiaceae bacterium DAT-1]